MSISTRFPGGVPISLVPSMRNAILDHLGTLSRDDLYDRFTMNPTQGMLESYVQRIDFVNDICLGIFERDLYLSSMIHLCVYGEIAELGASVAPEYQGQGRGVSLFYRAFERAIAAGIREIHLVAGHPAACHIARKLGHAVRYLSGYPGAIISISDRQEAVA